MVYPGQGTADSHVKSINGKSAWSISNNIVKSGFDPYIVSNPEMTQKIMKRERDVTKEIS